MNTDRTYELKDTLVSLKDVCLSYDGKPVLNHITAEVKDIVRPNCVTGQIVGILGPSGIGKCLAKGMPVLMFDGSIRKVEDVTVGDLLMGPDSRPRRVLDLGHGFDQMYRIVPTKGDPYIVNSAHILPLKVCRSGHIKARHDLITVEEYRGQSRTYKNRAKMYRANAIDFPTKPLPVDPYFFGLWLGDGSADSATITNNDEEEIVCAIEEVALAVGSELSRYAYGNKCPRFGVVNRKGSGRSSATFLSSLRATGAVNNKHIPLLYKANSREVRLQLLAGLLDSDGGLESKCFCITQKIKRLAEDICYVARSLGFAAYIQPVIKRCQTGASGLYHRVTISGHTDQIPLRLKRKVAEPRRQIKDVLHVGFTVEDVGVGEYFGFELDGDGLFLLGDFTVTHNTQLSLVMAGLQPPTSGEVIVAKKAPPGEEVVRDGIVGYVPQDYPLFAHRRVLGNLTIAARQRGLDAKQAEEEAMRYLNMFDLADKKFAFPAQLSGGQRQRISIAQQLLCSEHYLIMDEPTTGLDPVMKDKVCDLIKQVACIAEENTIFLISHDIESVLTLADTLWIMGRTFDDKKQSLGASIKFIYNLIERGIAWSDNPKAVPGFSDLQREIRAKFDEL